MATSAWLAVLEPALAERLSLDRGVFLAGLRSARPVGAQRQVAPGAGSPAAAALPSGVAYLAEAQDRNPSGQSSAGPRTYLGRPPGAGGSAAIASADRGGDIRARMVRPVFSRSGPIQGHACLPLVRRAGFACPIRASLTFSALSHTYVERFTEGSDSRSDSISVFLRGGGNDAKDPIRD
jgi:hypothetical protein